MITVEESARNYFLKLVEQQEMSQPGLRLWVDNPGTPTAECQLAFCEPGEAELSDKRLALEDLTLYIAGDSVPALDNAIISFQTDATGGQLSVKAPNLKGHEPGADEPLTDRVNWLLTSEINPMVAQHGGQVVLETVTEEGVAVLRFGGGCHGCGMVDVTLKQGIERNLRERIPEITGVRDVTDHASGENPYY